MRPVDLTGAPADLWIVTLRHVATEETTLIHPSQPDTAFTFELDERTDGFTATWSGVECDRLPGVSLLVEVEAQIPNGEPLVEFSIQVVPSAPDHSLYRVEFPRVRVALLGGETDEVLAFPWVGGWPLSDPAHNIHMAADAPIIHPGFISMQWWAYYDSSQAQDRPVLFWGTRDHTGHHKEYQLGPVPADPGETPTGLSLRVHQFPSWDLVPGYEGRSVGEFVVIAEDGQPVTELDDAGNPAAWIDHSTPFSADYSIFVAERSARFLLLAPAPRLDPVDPVEITVGQSLEIRLTGTLVDGAPYVFTSPELPPGAILDPVAGLFVWRPESAHVGEWTVTFAVEDGLYVAQGNPKPDDEIAKKRRFRTGTS